MVLFLLFIAQGGCGLGILYERRTTTLLTLSRVTSLPIRYIMILHEITISDLPTIATMQTTKFAKFWQIERKFKFRVPVKGGYLREGIVIYERTPFINIKTLHPIDLSCCQFILNNVDETHSRPYKSQIWCQIN